MHRERSTIVLPPPVTLQRARGIDGVFEEDPYPILNCTRGVGTSQIVEGNWDGSFRPGQFRINPVVMIKTESEKSDGFLEGKQQLSPYFWAGSRLSGAMANRLFGDPNQMTSWSADLAMHSVFKAYSKLSEPDADVGLMIAELNQTLNLLFNPFSALLKFLRKSRKKSSRLKRRLKDARRTGDLLADTWMQYRYGVRPLLGDIDDIIRVATTRSIVHPRFKRVRGTVKQVLSSSSIVGGETVASLGWSLRETKEWTEKYATVVYYSYHTYSAGVRYLEKYGLNPFQVPALLWEKVPFSFVVDWALDVGTWLRAITPTAGLLIHGGCTTHKCESHSTVDQFGPTFNGSSQFVTAFTPAKSSVKYTAIDRRLSLEPSGYPMWDPPTWKVGRVADALSIIWQGINKLFRR